MKQFLKKTKRFIMHYWLSISLGMILLKAGSGHHTENNF